jgi:hypothetical protein
VDRHGGNVSADTQIPKKSQKNPEKNKISNGTFEEAPGEGACVKIPKMDPISKKG